jgi:tRNA(Arg) A34 adenosine deaminase TadA
MHGSIFVQELTVRLPPWVEEYVGDRAQAFTSDEDRMRLVIGLARQNVQLNTGGPFAAAVCDDSGRFVAAGVNLVTSRNLSVLHAEIVALSLAQQTLGRYDLSDGGRLLFDLYTATEPCAMCFGAVLWSGIRRLVCGARSDDARAVGFDEGPKVPEWTEALAIRNIMVRRDLLREDAAAVLKDYIRSGGTIYNAGPPVPRQR